MRKVFIIEGNDQYSQMFSDKGWDITNDFFKADLIQFTGGSDVSPQLYGQLPHPKNSYFIRRDLVEAGYYKWGERLGKKMAGICRGGQFLNVMNGGKMWQHVDGHAIYGTHVAYDVSSNRRINVTSTHHQMMIPTVHGFIVSYAREAHIKESMSDDGTIHSEMNNGQIDVEAVYYDASRSLCFQPHPEFDGADETRAYYFELLERYLKV